jgi:transcriptional regulator with XRE-family HTH domain
VLAAALRHIRVFHNLSSDKLAERLGYSKSYISEIETGKKRINMDVVEGYSEVFEIPVSSIFSIAESLTATPPNRSQNQSRRLVGKIIEWIATE